MSRAPTFLGFTALLLGANACEQDRAPVTGPRLVSNASVVSAEEVPERGVESPFDWVHAPDSALWRVISRAKGIAMVGLKAPGKRRGMFRGRRLYSADDRAHGLEALLAQRGVSPIRQSSVLPVVTVKFDSFEGLVRARKLPFVDYIEPVPHLFGMDGGSLCGGMNPYSTDPINVSFTNLGDAVPWTYGIYSHDIERAWTRTQGDNVRVAILDTGVDPGQDQFFSRFNAYPDPYVSREFLSRAVGPNDSGDDECGHGTRIAGVIGAPHDGQNMVGIAWKSDILSMRVGESVINDGSAVFYGLEYAVATWGAKVVEMAFWATNDYLPPYAEEPWCANPYDEGDPRYPYWVPGRSCWYDAFFNSLTDEIQFFYNDPSYDVLFVAAAGTLGWLGGPPFGWVAYPATLPEVIAVTGMERGGSRSQCSSYGSKVELAGYVAAAAPGSPRKGSAGVVNIDCSSGASADIAGIATLVRGAHPSWTNVRVRDALRLASQHPEYKTGGVGFGAVNAYKAVGGFSWLAIESGYCGDNSTSATAAPTGEGPFQYTWSNGATTPSTTFSRSGPDDLAPYSLSVTDLVENKTLSISGTLCNPGAIHLYIEGPDYLGSGESGYWWVQPEGGTPPYRFQWSGLASGTSWSVDAVIDHGGVVFLDVWDANNLHAQSYKIVNMY